MPGQPSLVARLFWTAVAGGGASIWYGRAGLTATGLTLGLVLLHHLGRPRRFRAQVRRVCRRHARTLALRRRQESFVDAYGTLIRDGWLRERDYFVARTLLPAIAARGFSALAETRRDAILAIVEEVAASVALPDEDDAPEDGVRYERFCADRLARAGWRTHETPASGDQGADIVAEQADTRLVVQCKRHGRPVGNAAVQEAAAAARYWSGDVAAVVSNAGFTPAARKLAAATGVLLLHHDDLADLRPARGSCAARS
ncbi:restriction endonuclease [uncultured Methylobacterium sp.]|uniref:restriction endonuclease n=1 Tax=uncultured Methylobacterium sp. TaxID=157278 RepID=UPI0035CB9935